jgi:hypothetical protein
MVVLHILEILEDVLQLRAILYAWFVEETSRAAWQVASTLCGNLMPMIQPIVDEASECRSRIIAAETWTTRSHKSSMET